MRRELRIAGFGGQGVILAGFILGRAVSVHTPMHATMTQSYGPESRGGSCEADIVVVGNYSESFAETIGRYASNEPHPCFGGSFKDKYPVNWQFANDKIFK